MGVWGFFFAALLISPTPEKCTERELGNQKSFQIRNLGAEIAVMKCIINALRCQATPPERLGERAELPDVNKLLCGPSLKCSDTKTGAGTSLLGCPLTRHRGPSAMPFPRGNKQSSYSVPHCSVCPCSLQKFHLQGSLGDFFIVFSQMLLLSQVWKYLIRSYCLIYKCFVLSLLLLFLDYPCVPLPFCPG